MSEILYTRGIVSDLAKDAGRRTQQPQTSRQPIVPIQADPDFTEAALRIKRDCSGANLDPHFAFSLRQSVPAGPQAVDGIIRRTFEISLADPEAAARLLTAPPKARTRTPEVRAGCCGAVIRLLKGVA
jgi:hypothetical protein